MGTSIYSRRNIRLLAGFVVLGSLILAYVMYKPAMATHTPADKVVASGRKVQVVAPQAKVELLAATLRTAKPTDLMMHVALECSIITDVVTGGSGTPAGGTSTGNAEGEVRVWIEIDGVALPVPIMSSSAPPQDPPPLGDDSDKVTFCDRYHQQNAADQETSPDGLDRYETYLETKDANAFNWVRLNMGNGVHTIQVFGTLTTSAVGNASAQAFVGNRTLIVEPAKLANDAQIQ